MQALLERKPHEPVGTLNYDEVLELIGNLDVKPEVAPPGHRIILARKARKTRIKSRLLLIEIRRFARDVKWMI